MILFLSLFCISCFHDLSFVGHSALHTKYCLGLKVKDYGTKRSIETKQVYFEVRKKRYRVHNVCVCVCVCVCVSTFRNLMVKDFTIRFS